MKKEILLETPSTGNRIPQPMPHRTLAQHLKDTFHTPVRKIPLDAGSTCPNRDGALSSAGCVFCNPQGSGTGLLASGLDLKAQYLHLTTAARRKYKATLFLAYLQSYTNTYGPPARLAGLISTLRTLPDLAGLCLGTRPDCLDQEKVAILADCGLAEIWLEIGLQSANDATLARINRGHTAAQFAQAVHLAANTPVRICAHVMAGLPGESERDFLDTIAFVNTLPVHGIKLHNLYVPRHTALAGWLAAGAYAPLKREVYIRTIAAALDILRPDIIIHRLCADPAPGELLAPAWAADKNGLIRDLRAALGWPQVN